MDCYAQSPQSLTLKNSEAVALHLWADVRGLGFYTPTPTRYLMLSALESGHGFGCAKVIPKEGWLAVEWAPQKLREEGGISPSIL